MNTRNINKTLVLNSAYIATHIVEAERAFVVHYKGNAEILYTHPDSFFTTPNSINKYPKPSIIRVKKWINIDYNKVPLTRENIYRRDQYKCVYCGKSDHTKLTLDHVLPKSRGGKDNWENLVTACNICNGEKADMLLEEWGKPNPNPRRPHFLLLLKKNIGTKIPEEWKPYLFF
jgi:hypothetical protein